MSEETTPRSQQIAEVWAARPANVLAPKKAVKHTLKFERDAETAQRLGADGETVFIMGTPSPDGDKDKEVGYSVDVSALWAVDVSILRSYAAPAALLDGQQLYKARVLRGEAEPNDQQAMQQAFEDILSKHATLAGITPSAGGTGGGGGGGGGDAKKLSDAADRVTAARAALKAAKDAKDKQATADAMDEFESALDAQEAVREAIEARKAAKAAK